MRSIRPVLHVGILTLWAAGCGDAQATPPDAAVMFDAAAPAPPCGPATGAGTQHTTAIDADETWTAAASPHVLPFDLQIRQGTLTIEACAEVRTASGHQIQVGVTSGPTTAALVAHGERLANPDGSVTTHLVTFVPDQAGTHWGSIRVFPTGRVDLEQVRLESAGEQATAQSLGGTIVAVGAGGPTLQPMVRLRSVTILGSGGLGVNLQGFAAFSDDSTDLVIHGSGAQPSSPGQDTSFPLFVTTPALHTIPPGDYTGNATDEIQVNSPFPLIVDETFRDRGLPYRIRASFSMAPLMTLAQGGLVTLTIEPGVTIRINKRGPPQSFNLGVASGDLPAEIRATRVIAAGTAARPIVFTSAEASPAAGDWGGIEWAGGPPTGNVVSHVRIEYGGGDSGTVGFGCGPGDNDALLIITNWRPDTAFIQDSIFADSLGGGIVSGWRSDQDGPILRAGNSFSNIGSGCEVARWANRTAPCPGNDSVPDCL